jgi:tetratricopeptide (TPR) repeat protein
MLGDKEDYKGAVADFSEALKHAPDASVLRLNRAKMYLACYRYNEALEDCRCAMQLNEGIATKDGPALMADVHVALGRDAHERKEYDRAITEFTRAIELAPKDARAYFLRNVTYFTKGDLARSQLDADEAARLSPAFKISKWPWHTRISNKQGLPCRTRRQRCTPFQYRVRSLVRSALPPLMLAADVVGRAAARLLAAAPGPAQQQCHDADQHCRLHLLASSPFLGATRTFHSTVRWSAHFTA